MKDVLQHSFLTLALASVEQDSDGWIMLFPAGTSRGADGRGPYHVPTDIAGMEKIIAASLREKVDIAIDRDHQFDILPAGSEKIAAGWIKELQARKDGIYGRADWTPRSRQQLADKEYRYISPGFFHDKAGNVKRIFRASLVNDPNLEMKAVAAADRLATTTNKETEMEELLKKLAALLGVADASEAAVLDAVKALKGTEEAVKEAADVPADAPTEQVVSKIEEALAAAKEAKAKKDETRATAAADPTKFVPIEAFEDLKKTLAAVQKTQTDGEVEKAVADATAAGKLTPAQQDWAKAYAAKDMPGFKSYIAASPVIVKAGSQATKAKTDGKATVLDDEQKALCASLGLKEEDYLKQLAKQNA